MRRADFDFVRQRVRQETAIVLDEGKEYLVESRLTPVARRSGCKGLDELVDKLRRGDRRLLGDVLDAMTTNETSFFRDESPWVALREQMLPTVVAARRPQRKLAIWSAACSSGQEAYTTAMIIRESFPELLDWDLRIIGTDISPTVLEKAREGRYIKLELDRGLPGGMQGRWFHRETDGSYRLADEIRSMVEFRKMNLATRWPLLPTFDIIFLRNVLIYFDLETKVSILQQAERHLAKDGFLLLGSGETTLNMDVKLQRASHKRAWFYRHAG